MVSHFVLMLLFAVCVSVVFAALLRDEPAEQVRFGGVVLAGFMVTGVVLSWLLYPFPL